MSNENCCGGDCPEIKCTPETPCGGRVIDPTPFECVRPLPRNESLKPQGNFYGCANMFQLCPIEPDTFTEDQVAILEQTILSAMVYFPSYSVLNNQGCGCDGKVMYGREGSCTDYLGGVFTAGPAACLPAPLAKLACGCKCGQTSGLAQYWTPTTPSQCCKVLEVDEAGEPVLDANDEPVYTAQQFLFGAVPASHPHWTKYGGTPSAGIDMDMMMPATQAKIVGLFCKLMCVIQDGGPS